MDYTVLDLEMTGLTPKRDKVIEIGAVRVRNGEIADTYGTLVRPGMSIPETVVQLTGITDEMAALGKEENVAMQELLQFIGDDILVGHNLIFDYSFLKQWAVNQKIPLELSACDTLRIARALLPGAQSKKLESLCEYFQIEREHAHRALDDAVETYKVFENLKSIEDAYPWNCLSRNLWCTVDQYPFAAGVSANPVPYPFCAIHQCQLHNLRFLSYSVLHEALSAASISPASPRHAVVPIVAPPFAAFPQMPFALYPLRNETAP